MLNKSILDEGGTGTSFETDIMLRRNLEESEVDSGLSRGDLVLFDFGAKLPSTYLSDVRRTIPFSTGSNEKLRNFMNDVYSINREGLRKTSSGKTGNQVREDIDSIIKEHGYVSAHRPGHQIGLNVHEPFGPELAYGEENSIQLKPGNVVTWEPGIGLSKNDKRMYRNRFGMAHLEDMVLVGTPSKVLGDLKLEYW
jgi:Xaa-Pro aminopeptidase